MLKLRDGNLERGTFNLLSPGKISQRCTWRSSCRSQKLVRILPPSLMRKYFECFQKNYSTFSSKVLSAPLDFSGFCGGSALLLSERRGKWIQIKAALQDVYSPSVGPNLIFCPLLMSVIPSQRPLFILFARAFSFRSRRRLSVSGADGRCSGSWGLTPSTSSPPSAATATTSAPRSPWRLSAAPPPAGRLSAASASRPCEARLKRSRLAVRVVVVLFFRGQFFYLSVSSWSAGEVMWRLSCRGGPEANLVESQHLVSSSTDNQSWCSQKDRSALRQTR